MKKIYKAPESELTQLWLSLILNDSLVDSYGGEDAVPIDGEW